MPTCPALFVIAVFIRPLTINYTSVEVTIQPAVVVTPMRDQDVGLITARWDEREVGPSLSFEGKGTGREVEEGTSVQKLKCGNH